MSHGLGDVLFIADFSYFLELAAYASFWTLPAGLPYYLAIETNFLGLVLRSLNPFSRSVKMSYYEPQGWQAPAARQVSWEQPAPPSRSGTASKKQPRTTVPVDRCGLADNLCAGSSSVSQREEIPAFSSQFDGME